MSCFVDNILNLNDLNDSCNFNLAGVKSFFTAKYDENLFKNLKIDGDRIININYPITFQEVVVNEKACKFEENYNFQTKKYDQKFLLDLNTYDTDKRSAIDLIIKTKQIFIIQDNNQKYFMFGEKTGVLAQSANMGTGTQNDKTGYTFNFQTSSNYAALGIDRIVFEMAIDCDDLIGETCLNSIKFWNPYKQCLIFP